MQALHNLICDLFPWKHDELRRFLSYGEQGGAILCALPEGGSLNALVEASIGELVRRGLLAKTLERLRETFPKRNADIDRVLGLLRVGHSALVDDGSGLSAAWSPGVDATVGHNRGLNLPALKGICFDRKPLLSVIETALVAPEPAYVIINGPPGIGKSTLALEVMRRSAVVERYAARRFWARLQGATSADTAAGHIAAALGLYPGQSSIGTVRAFLNTVEHPLLLVLDDADTSNDEDYEKFHGLISQLCEHPLVSLVLTLRMHDWPTTGRTTTLVTVDGLADPDALQVISHVAALRDPGGDPVAPQTLQALGGVPLLLVLFARLVRSVRSISRAWQRLIDGGPGVLSIGRGDGAHDSFRRLMQECLSNARMTRVSRRIAALLARLPAGVPNEVLCKLLPDVPPWQVSSDGVDVLAQLLFAYEDAGRLRQLAVISEWLRAHCPPEPEDWHNTRTYYQALVRELGPRAGRLAGGSHAAAQLLTEQTNIEAVVLDALEDDDPRSALEVAALMGEFQRFTSEVPLRLLRRASEVARARGDLPRSAKCAMLLARAAYRRYELDEADALLRDALDLYEAIGARLGQASCLLELGLVAGRLYHYAEAEALLRRGLAIFQTENDAEGRTTCLKHLGDLAVRQSRLEEAAELFGAGLALAVRSGLAAEEAWCLAGLGDIALTHSRLGEASPKFERAQELFEHTADLEGLAKCRRKLGEIARREQRYDDASRLLKSSVQLSTEIDNRLPIALALKDLGVLALDRKDRVGARKLFEEAQGLFERFGNTLNIGILWRRWGQMALADGDLEGARSALERALAMVRKVGNKKNEAHCLRDLAKVAVRRSEVEQALPFLESAMGVYEIIGDRLNVGNCFRDLGDALKRGRRRESAARAYESALEIYRQEDRVQFQGLVHERLAAMLEDRDARAARLRLARDSYYAAGRSDLAAGIEAALNELTTSVLVPRADRHEDPGDS